MRMQCVLRRCVPRGRLHDGRCLSGYKGFGSFHSENVEELVAAACEAAWEAPAVPSVVAAVSTRASRGVAFGSGLRRSEFLLDEAWTFVNHGAFGAPCRRGVEAADAWRRHAEAQPLRFVDRELFPQLVASLACLGRVLGVSPRTLALVPNATTALNVAIPAAAAARAVGPGDAVLALDVGYGSVAKIAARTCDAVGAEVVDLPVLRGVPDSARPEAVLDAVDAALYANAVEVKVAVFDHVTSNTALTLPVADLVALCRSRDVAVVVDGAHSLGSHSLDGVFDADYVCGNLHKWFCGPRGAGFLYVRPGTEAPDPLVVSHGYGDGFASDFLWSGAADYSVPLALPAVAAWWDDVGLDRAKKYNADLCSDAVQLLADSWNTEPLTDDRSGPMALVRVPNADGAPKTPTDGKALQDALHYRRSVECPVKTVNGELYVRISAAVYNDLDDYRALAAAVADVLPNLT